MTSAEEYWEALQSRICSKCADGNGQGGCMIAPGRTCALKTFLPQILEAVNAVYSSSIAPYEEQLRKKVCGRCAESKADGSCAIRDDVECALDRYFPLIVQVLEETQLKKRFGSG
jgi:hypothetical protein